MVVAGSYKIVGKNVEEFETMSKILETIPVFLWLKCKEIGKVLAWIVGGAAGCAVVVGTIWVLCVFFTNHPVPDRVGKMCYFALVVFTILWFTLLFVVWIIENWKKAKEIVEKRNGGTKENPV